MSVVCNKCGSSPPHGSDSWCLACSALEQLGAELKGTWGAQGTRAIASDLIASCLRQVRALRRFGLAQLKPAEPLHPPPGRELSGVRERERSRAPAVRPVDKGAREESRKLDRTEERRDASPEEDEEESFEEESEEEEEEPKATAPKAKATPREGADRDKERSRSRARSSHHREGGSTGHRDRSRSPLEREELPRRRSHRRYHGRSGEERGRGRGNTRKRYRPGHRGGARHQKFHRAIDDPYRRFHHQQPDSFWDRDHFDK